MAIEKVVNIKVQEQGFDDLNNKVKILENSLEDLQQQNTSLRSSLASSGKSVLDNGGAMGLLNDATGGLAMTIKDAVEATDLFTKSTKAQTTFQKIYTAVMGTSTGAMKAFRIALISTGIGAIVVAIGMLIANFDKVKKVVMNAIPGLQAIGNIFGDLVEMVTDFIGVTSEASRSIDKMVEDSNASLKKNEHFLEANGDKFDEYTQRKIKANIDYNKKVKELAENEELSEQEKLKRMAEFRAKANREIEKADKDREEANRKKREERQKEELNAYKENAKNRADALEKIRLGEIDTEEEKRKEELLQVQRQYADLIALAKKYGQNTEELKKAQRTKELELKEKWEKEDKEKEKEKQQKELDYWFAEADKAIERTEKNREQEKKAQDDISAILEEGRKRELEARQAFEVAKMNVAEQGLALLSNFANKSKTIATAVLLIEKSLAISQVITNASKSIAATKAAMAPTPLNPPFLAPGVLNPSYFSTLKIGAASILATKIGAGLSIANILAQTVGKLGNAGNLGGGSSSGASSGTGGGVSAPSFNLVGGTGTNQIATALGSQNKPIQAFVVGSAVSSQQELDRNAVNNASL